ncbi:MAG: hypothetical protein R2856_14645 [Caldilineaceae bacterium]
MTITRQRQRVSTDAAPQIEDSSWRGKTVDPGSACIGDGGL